MVLITAQLGVAWPDWRQREVRKITPGSYPKRGKLGWRHVLPLRAQATVMSIFKQRALHLGSQSRARQQLETPPWDQSVPTRPGVLTNTRFQDWYIEQYQITELVYWPTQYWVTSDLLSGAMPDHRPGVLSNTRCQDWYIDQHQISDLEYWPTPDHRCGILTNTRSQAWCIDKQQISSLVCWPILDFRSGVLTNTLS